MKLNVLWGLLIGAFLTIATQVGLWSLALPEPYKGVVVTSVERNSEGYVVNANFIKTECTFKRLEVFGINTGIPVYLEWKPLDGSPSTDYDRSIGKQHMIILAISAEKDYDVLEIRTRHDCEGVSVDKVFATIKTT